MKHSRFSLRWLFAATAIAAIVFGGVHRIARNKATREATYEVWSLGALTASDDNPMFTAPQSNLAWLATTRSAGLWNDLAGVYQPVAILVPNRADAASIDQNWLEQFMQAISDLPHLRVVAFERPGPTEAQFDELRSRFPRVEFEIDREESRLGD